MTPADAKSVVEPMEEALYRSFALRVLAVDLWRRGKVDEAMEVARRALALSAKGDSPTAFNAAAQAVAMITAALEDDERATVLFGAVRAAQETHTAARTVLSRRGEIANLLEGLEARLGSERFRELMNVGRLANRNHVLQLAAGEPFDIEDVAEMRHVTDLDQRTAVLTRREAEIAGLVASGKSNADIATELYLSRRTVEGHLERAFTKLGLSSRTQLAVWVHENNARAMQAQPGRTRSDE